MGTDMPVSQEFQERIGRIEGLVQKLETTGDPALRRIAKELMESLMELHGACLDRVLEIVVEAKPELVESLGNDSLVGGLLVLYGLHPEDFETRVRRGLDKARPLLRSHGARVDPVTISDHTVRMTMTGAGSQSLEASIREAVLEAAPDAAEVVIEGGKPAGQASSFVPLSSLRSVKGSTVTPSLIPS
jgi:hypothetical protein